MGFIRRDKTVRVIAVVAAATAMILVEAVQAGLAGAKGWPKSILTYRISSKYDQSVKSAVEMWNDAPTKIKFVPAAKGSRADIRVTDVKVDDFWTARGELPPGGRIYLNTLKLGEPYNTLFQINVVAHELGHTIGLRHSKFKCTLMYHLAILVTCQNGIPEGRLACGPQRADVNQVNRLYGWASLQGQYRHTCPIEDALGSWTPPESSDQRDSELPATVSN